MTTATDQLTNKLLEIVNQIQQGIVAHGADAVNLALQSVSADGMANLLPGFIGLGVLLVSIVVGLISLNKFLKIQEFNRSVRSHEEKDNVWCIPIIIIFGFVSFIASMFVFGSLGNYWNWVQFLNPKVYLAHEIIQRVMR